MHYFERDGLLTHHHRIAVVAQTSGRPSWSMERRSTSGVMSVPVSLRVGGLDERDLRAITAFQGHALISDWTAMIVTCLGTQRWTGMYSSRQCRTGGSTLASLIKISSNDEYPPSNDCISIVRCYMRRATIFISEKRRIPIKV
jgi:hypothetical protein